MKDLDIENIREKYKNRKRDSIEENLNLDKVENFSRKEGFKIYFVSFIFIIQLIGLPTILIGSLFIGYFIYKRKYSY